MKDKIIEMMKDIHWIFYVILGVLIIIAIAIGFFIWLGRAADEINELKNADE